MRVRSLTDRGVQRRDRTHKEGMSMHGTSKFVKNKVIIRIRDRVCETPEELMESELFAEVVKRYISHLQRRSAPAPGDLLAGKVPGSGPQT
ncbi:MAG: hypothetical protein U5N26_04805 [Candidatus Marinimicrobia bacterium]|nr:hypothetical protein [Candidatus Neomarinimicrobiota bacterium]